jgi:hypothetical protein
MIDFFKGWLPQIISYAEMVSDGTLRNAWENGDTSQTSTYYSGELDEQLFGDLHFRERQGEMRSLLKDQPQLIDALDLFLLSVSRLIEWADHHVDTETWGKGQVVPSNVTEIFRSEEWVETETRASQLLAAAEAAGFSSSDFDPT